MSRVEPADRKDEFCPAEIQHLLFGKRSSKREFNSASSPRQIDLGLRSLERRVDLQASIYICSSLPRASARKDKVGGIY